MITDTLNRIAPVVPKKNTYVITNKVQLSKARKICRALPINNIIAEPVGRNTAPCLGLAALFAKKKDPKEDGVLIALPADHIIKNEKKFQSLLKRAISVANKAETIVVFGITPEFPETGFGYIEVSSKQKKPVLKVKRFVEKPNLNTAKQYLKTKRFYWNSGIFVARSSVLLNAYQKYLPSLFEDLCVIEKTMGTSKFQITLNKVYPRMDKVSIDYGIMEKYPDVQLIPTEVGWGDLGSWIAVADLYKKDKNKNSSTAQALFFDAQNCFVHTSDKKLVSVLGVKDLIIVSTDDALLITTPEHSQEVRKITDFFEKNNQKYSKYL